MKAYTLLFIRKSDSVLLLNRNKKPYMGKWNGVGGKRESGETALECALREAYEETDMRLKEVLFKGKLTWESDGVFSGEIDLYTASLPEDFSYDTPRKTVEGILDWKPVDWITQPDNIGVADNLPHFITKVLYDDTKYTHHCIFQGDRLISVLTKPFGE